MYQLEKVDSIFNPLTHIQVLPVSVFCVHNYVMLIHLSCLKCITQYRLPIVIHSLFVGEKSLSSKFFQKEAVKEECRDKMKIEEIVAEKFDHYYAFLHVLYALQVTR